MNNFAIQPLSPGEKPTEPGWYVVGWKEDGRLVKALARVGLAPCEDGTPRLSVSLENTGPPELVASSAFVFIARIYPERIEARTEG